MLMTASTFDVYCVDGKNENKVKLAMSQYNII